MIECKHDNGFSLYQWKTPEGLGIFVCNRLCGYHLNFDPGKYPDGIAYVLKEEKKEIPALVISRK